MNIVFARVIYFCAVKTNNAYDKEKCDYAIQDFGFYVIQ